MLASPRTPRRRKHTGWAVVAGRHVGAGHAPPANLAAAGAPAGWFGPLVKGGWLRRKPQTGGLFRSRQPFPKGCAGGVLCGWRPLPGGGISGRGNPSDRAWRRGHLPLTREANCGAGPATNRETVILMLLRTRVGADSISARSAAARTPAGGYGIRPYNGFFQCCSQPGNHDPRVTANLCRGTMLASSRTPRRRKHTGWAAASGGGISGRGNPSDRAWRRGHLPLTREANGGAGPATNRETVILMLLRTRVGADSISARSSLPQTPPGGYGIRPYMGFPWYPAAPGCGFR